MKVTSDKLDRETQDLFYLTVIAEDGGERKVCSTVFEWLIWIYFVVKKLMVIMGLTYESRYMGMLNHNLLNIANCK